MSQCLCGHGGRHGRRTSMPQKMLLDLHFILRLYLGQINTKVYHRPFKWWSHSLGGPAPNFSTKIKIITQAKQNKWFPTYLLLLRDAKNVEECEESERCRQNTPNSPGLWASWDDHLLPPGQDMTCNDDVIMRHQDDGDPETDDRMCQYIVHISTPLLHLPLYPSFSSTQPSIDQSKVRIKVRWSVSTNRRIVCFLSYNLSPVYLNSLFWLN